MKISLAWLKEWVEIEQSPEALAEALSNAGFEVEAIEYQDQYLKKIVVAEIISADPHPNADKLRITRARTGNTGEELQIVTAAANVSVGDKVPLALIGARLGEDFEIKKAKLRGVDSFGMYCSEKELGLAKESSGVMILPTDARIGMEIADYLDKKDVILDVTSTANRGDCLSYLGMAREVAAISNKTLRKSLSVLGASPGVAPIRLENRVPDDCRLYFGRVMEGIRVGESPAWLQKKLLSSGMKPVNNVVDITNYVMLETGQPLHAFDLDEINKGAIIVRKSSPGESIETLDGVVRTLSSEEMVIADEVGPLAIAGLMGGKRGEVGTGTHRILIEAAYFQSTVVRQASKRQNLRTEASHRFERGVDPEGVKKALETASYWIAELCKGRITSADVTSQTGSFESPRIELRIGRVNRVLGTSLSFSTIQDLLNRLHFKTKAQGDSLSVEVPSFRREDVTREADLIEEISRIYGYQNIEATLPSGWEQSRLPLSQYLKGRIREKLVAFGLQEVATYSMVSAQLCERVLSDYPMQNLIPVANPLTEDYSHMRDSLIPSLLEVAQKNMSRQEKNLFFFEIGKIFKKGSKDHGEALRVCGLVSGEYLSTWSQKTIQADFFLVKGMIEDLLDFLGIHQKSYSILDQDHRFHPGRSAKIQISAEALGYLGELDPRIAQRFDLGQKVYVFDLDFDLLVRQSSLLKKYQPLPPYPAMSRDLAFMAKESLSHSLLEEAIKKRGGSLLKSVRLFDCYQGEPIPSGYKSMAYSLTFMSPEKTLNEDEVNPVLENIVAALEKEFDIQLRSQ